MNTQHMCVKEIRGKAVICETAECYSRCSTLSPTFPLLSPQGSRLSAGRKKQESRKCFHVNGVSAWSESSARCKFLMVAPLCDKQKCDCHSTCGRVRVTPTHAECCVMHIVKYTCNEYVCVCVHQNHSTDADSCVRIVCMLFVGGAAVCQLGQSCNHKARWSTLNNNPDPLPASRRWERILRRAKPLHKCVHLAVAVQLTLRISWL